PQHLGTGCLGDFAEPIHQEANRCLWRDGSGETGGPAGSGALAGIVYQYTPRRGNTPAGVRDWRMAARSGSAESGFTRTRTYAPVRNPALAGTGRPGIIRQHSRIRELSHG